MGLSTLYYTIFMPYLPLRRASAISVHRPQNKPMASAYSDLPYVATMFRNILRLGVIWGMSWSYELELESGVYFFIKVVSIRLISAAKVSVPSIDSRYPNSFAISSCVIVSYNEPRAIDRK